MRNEDAISENLRNEKKFDVLSSIKGETFSLYNFCDAQTVFSSQENCIFEVGDRETEFCSF